MASRAPSASSSSPWLCLLTGLFSLFATQVVTIHALAQSLCSSQNTGSDSQVVNDHWQSNGRCFDTCKASYAFAVVQAQNCWCSNYAPADTTSIGSCSSPCPGYPFEQCGSSGFFGYIPLNKAPLGTVGASQSQQSSTSSPIEVATSTTQVVSSPTLPQMSSRSIPSPVRPSVSSTSPIAEPQLSSRTSPGSSPSPPPPLSFATSTLVISQILTPSVQTPPTPKPVTVQQTVTAPPSVEISLVSVTPSTIPETTPQPTPETTTETTTTSTPAKASTQFIPVPVSQSTTSTPSPSAFPTFSTSSTASSSSSTTKSTWTPTPITSVITVTGQVKTITITPTAPPASTEAAQSQGGGFMSHPGKVAGLFVGVGLIICLIAAGLIWFFLRRKRDAEAETIASTAGGGGETPQRRQSKLSTMGLLGGTRRSNNRKSVPAIQTSGWGPGNNSTEKSPTDTPIDYRRTSYPRIVDQRLEPTALWNPLQDNGSHISIQSFRDDQDYSRRMLRVANPDDRPISRD